MIMNLFNPCFGQNTPILLKTNGKNIQESNFNQILAVFRLILAQKGLILQINKELRLKKFFNVNICKTYDFYSDVKENLAKNENWEIYNCFLQKWLIF